jgi:hypothetical protein
MVAEQVADDHEEDHQPGREEKDLEHGQEHLTEADVSENHSFPPPLGSC